MSDLVHKRGTAPVVGAWDHPLDDPNLEDAPIVHALDRFAGMPGLGRAESIYRSRFRLKSWQYMTAVSDELFIAFVVGTAGFASNGFVYAVDLATKQLWQKFAINPLKLRTTVSPTSARGKHSFSADGLDVGIAIEQAGRVHATDVRAQTTTGERLESSLRFASAATDEHLAICVPLPGGRWNYTHKFMAFRVSGSVTIGGREFRFDPAKAFGTLDFTKMYALRHAIWKWIALSGTTKQGKHIGLNLVDPTPDAPISENAVWIDGVRDAITGVEITADPAPDGPWQLGADSLDVSMAHVAHVEQRLDLPLVKHTLRHVIGAFSGRIRTKSGHIHDFENIVGIAEDFDNLW